MSHEHKHAHMFHSDYSTCTCNGLPRRRFSKNAYFFRFKEVEELSFPMVSESAIMKKGCRVCANAESE